MLLLSFPVILLANLVSSAVNPTCSPAPSSPASPCVLTYHNSQAPQVGPATTVYNAIVTTTFHIVDCHYCTVTNVDANPTPSGLFTTKITKDVLEITHIACIQETSVSTRGRPVDYGYAKEIRAGPAKRSAQQVSEKLAEFTPTIDPDTSKLSVEAYNLIKQLHSAIFALDIVNSLPNLPQICQDLRLAYVQLQMLAASLFPQQVSDIVCWASVYGIDLNTTSTELLSDLAAAIYAVEIGSGYTTDLDRLCKSVNLASGPSLGFDAPGIQSIICQNSTTSATASYTTAKSASSPKMPAGTGLPPSTGGVGTIGTGMSGTAATGGVGPYANQTAYPGTAGTAGTIYGTGSGPYTFSNSTWYGNRLPPNPTAPAFYPIWTTSTMTTASSWS